MNLLAKTVFSIPYSMRTVANMRLVRISVASSHAELCAEYRTNATNATERTGKVTEWTFWHERYSLFLLLTFLPPEEGYVERLTHFLASQHQISQLIAWHHRRSTLPYMIQDTHIVARTTFYLTKIIEFFSSVHSIKFDWENSVYN